MQKGQKMRHAEPSSKFRRDVKRVRGGIYGSILSKGGEVDRVIRMLEAGISLPLKYRDHGLHGDWEGKRECHIRPDLLLVYRYEGDDVLILERLGSHSELFGM